MNGSTCPECFALLRFGHRKGCMVEEQERYAERIMQAVMPLPQALNDRETTTPAPPTLREWLGPNGVATLGPWAGVLRERPVPAGMITSWEWIRVVATCEWTLRLWHRNGNEGLSREHVAHATRPRPFRDMDVDTFAESLQMALFTRDPRVEPEPTPAAFPWDPYPDA